MIGKSSDNQHLDIIGYQYKLVACSTIEVLIPTFILRTLESFCHKNNEIVNVARCANSFAIKYCVLGQSIEALTLHHTIQCIPRSEYFF